ncbi:flagellar basal body-associated protein FliL [candidate division KSB1 bacterium]
MEDELQEEQAGGEEIKQPPKKGGKKPIMLVGIILVQVVIAYILWVAIIKPKFFPEEEPVQEEVVQEEVKDEEIPWGFIYSIEKVTVNVPDGKRNRYLMTGFGIEVPNEGVSQRLDERLPEVKDILISALRARAIEDLQDPDYMDSLKVELKDKLNKALRLLPEEQILRMHFTEYIIQ